ncbi:MAG: hypothetical protein HKP27_10400, partial [Myxococcales bacterium]|nr:hypothetical protein [Myxococcales bacterium]
MRTLATAATCVGLWVSLATTALAQGAAPTAPPPDVPAGEARITGRVVHRDDPERGIAGIEVALYALSEDGNPGLRGAQSDERGAFTFDGISASPRIAYFVGARYGGVPFPGARVVFSPGETERTVEVPVSELRSEADDIAIPQVTLQLDWRGRELLVSESVELLHAYSETLFVPAEDRDTKAPFASIPLPADARNLEYPFGVAPEGVERREGGLAFFGPLHPGEPQAVRFGYAFASAGDTLSLEFPVPQGSARVELLVPSNGPEAETTLRREGPVEIADRQYIRYVAEAPKANETVLAAFTLPDASTDGSRARVASAQWVVDADAALLSLREEYVVEVSGREPIVAPP